LLHPLRWRGEGLRAETYPTTAADFPRRGRSTRYRKVFRLDGTISTDDWSLVASLWFRGNQLILEYLGGLDTVRNSGA